MPSPPLNIEPFMGAQFLIADQEDESLAKTQGLSIVRTQDRPIAHMYGLPIAWIYDNQTYLLRDIEAKGGCKPVGEVCT